MVKQMGSEPSRQPNTKQETDWLAIFLEYEAGVSADDLATRLGCQVGTIRNRASHYRQVLSRLEMNLGERLKLHLSVAEQAIAAGQTTHAEKAAKAVLAIIRAARSLEQWRGDMQKDSVPGASQTHEEMSIEELRAELEQKIARLIEDRANKAEMAQPVQSGAIETDDVELGDPGSG